MATENHSTFRAVTFKLHPCTKAKHDLLTQTAGACRFVWNHFLAENERKYRLSQNVFVRGLPQYQKPSVTFQGMGLEFTKLRNKTPWLQSLPCHPVRYTLKYQSDAWKRAFRGKGGFPNFHKRRGDDSFTIPNDVKISGSYIYISRIGWIKLSRKGGNPYDGCKAVKATVKRVCGKWYCVVSYEVPEQPAIDNGLAVGVDMNTGQVAVSTGDILRMPARLKMLEARKKRYQRMMARRKKGSNRRAKARHLKAKTERRIANLRHNWQHQVSRQIADTAGVVAIENLNTKGMTASAKGTVDNPGKNVKAKSGLNREISNTGWSQLRQMLEYKAAHVVAVNPAYTSQTCHECGVADAANRKKETWSQFNCVHCGHSDNADINAALNILASGIGASGRRGATVLLGRPNDPSISTRVHAIAA